MPPVQRVPALTETPPGPPTPPGADEELLATGSIEVRGRIPGASNATLLVTVTDGNREVAAVHKPVRGERPLWDFPTGTLAGREVATYLLAREAGLDVVPPTVLRTDGPFGTGSLQLWVGEPADDDPGAGVVDLLEPHRVPEDWRTVLLAEDQLGRPVALCHADRPDLRALALLDAVTNNSDRKGGHVLLTADGAVRGCDHGLTFNVDDKLRTVLWGWAGDPLGEADQRLLASLEAALRGGPAVELAGHLTAAEVVRAAERAARLLELGCFPEPAGGWPPIPWPAF